ncbi:MAG: hypothetical protein WEF50_10670 [Myxococcota bacterium]
MPDRDEPFDEQAAQRADQNAAHDIVESHAPPFGRGDLPPANQDQPLTPEEKQALFAQYFPAPEARDRGQSIGDFLLDLGRVLARARELELGSHPTPGGHPPVEMSPTPARAESPPPSVNTDATQTLFDGHFAPSTDPNRAKDRER